MGNRIWLYLYICDIVDWDTGKIDQWTDKAAATELNMPHKTLTRQRQTLETEGYIKCTQKPRGLSIQITKWENPRRVPKKGQGTQKRVPKRGYSEVGMVPKNEAEGDIKVSTPTSTSHLTTLKDRESDSPPLEYVDVGKEFDGSSKKKKGKRDPLLDTVPIKVYREVLHFHVPRNWRENVVSVVGDNGEEWGRMIREWQGRGWNPRNVAGMLDAFPKYLKSGKLGGRQKRDDATTRLERRMNG